MSIYLKDIPLVDAQANFHAALQDADLWKILGEEEVILDETVSGRVLAESIWAKISSPHYSSAAMDGFAVRAANTVGALPANPIILVIGAEAAYLDTGDPLPDQFDAVIPIENVESLDVEGKITRKSRKPHSIRIRSAVTPWSHIRPLGEDIVQTQLVLPAGQILRPVDLGAIAAAGYQQIKVSQKPKVAVLPTGTELVPIGSTLRTGDILEYNSLVMAAQVQTWGGIANRYSIIPDNLEAICTRVQDAARNNDLILLNAGSSAGEEDYSSTVVEKLGTLLVHGVAIRPGHPVILGLIEPKKFTPQTSASTLSSKKVPIIGVPGYPVSAALTSELFVEPLLAKWLGRNQLELPIIKARLTHKITSPSGDDDFIRVIVGKVGEKKLAAPLSRGAGSITSLVHADGIVILHRGIQGVKNGEEMDVHLYRNMAEIERTIFCIGSHDLSLDILAQLLAGKNRRFISSNVGSLGGIISLQRGEAHLTGSHLLDPKTGEYNLKYIRQYLIGIPVNVFGFVGRKQGLIIKKGNPKDIYGLHDLVKHGIQFINRQRGAGTRVLLEYQLNNMGIETSAINGFEQEEYTHLGVAAAVASGRADCGLGIPGAALALNLEFIPLFDETYQLIIPKKFMDSALLDPLFEVLNSTEFQEKITGMPGYDISDMGKLVAEV